jgi:hypothetical protein
VAALFHDAGLQLQIAPRIRVLPPPEDAKGDQAGPEQGQRGRLWHRWRWRRQRGLGDKRVGDELEILARLTGEEMAVNRELVQIDGLVRYQESPVECGAICRASDITTTHADEVDQHWSGVMPPVSVNAPSKALLPVPLTSITTNCDDVPLTVRVL